MGAGRATRKNSARKGDNITVNKYPDLYIVGFGVWVGLGFRPCGSVQLYGFAAFEKKAYFGPLLFWVSLRVCFTCWAFSDSWAETPKFRVQGLGCSITLATITVAFSHFGLLKLKSHRESLRGS